MFLSRFSQEIRIEASRKFGAKGCCLPQQLVEVHPHGAQNGIELVPHNGIRASQTSDWSMKRETKGDYATLRLSNGDSLAEVSKEMGHGSADITFRTYYKWLPKESKTNIDTLNGKIKPITKHNPGATKIKKRLSLVG